MITVFSTFTSSFLDTSHLPVLVTVLKVFGSDVGSLVDRQQASIVSKLVALYWALRLESLLCKQETEKVQVLSLQENLLE